MDLQIQMTKNKVFGWIAETSIPIGTAKDVMGRDGTRVLKVKTMKDRSALHTTASVAIVTGTSTQYALGGDFRERLGQRPVKLATEKAVKETHDHALKNIDAVIEAAVAFYASKNV